jgi:hypothetical protein
MKSRKVVRFLEVAVELATYWNKRLQRGVQNVDS